MLKYHHCLLDGVAGASLASVVLDLEPDATEPLLPPPPEGERTAGHDPSNVELLGAAIGTAVRRPIRMARYFGGLAAKVTMADSACKDDENKVLPGPEDAVQRAHRPAASWRSPLSMADVHALKLAHGVKVNDVVLAICGGAPASTWRSTMPSGGAARQRGVRVDPGGGRHDLRQPDLEHVRVPGHRRGRPGRATRGHQPVDHQRQGDEQGGRRPADPVPGRGRLTADPRYRHPCHLPDAADGEVAGAGQHARVERPRTTGPALCAAPRSSASTPSSVILEGMGVNITVFSYLDRIDFGIHVDLDLVPDPGHRRRRLGVADRADARARPRLPDGRPRSLRGRLTMERDVGQRRRPVAHGGPGHAAAHPEDRDLDPSRCGAPVTLDDVALAVGPRLGLVPRATQKVGAARLRRSPFWVDDADFDLRLHLEERTLPAPGDARQLDELYGDLATAVLARTDPRGR